MPICQAVSVLLWDANNPRLGWTIDAHTHPPPDRGWFLRRYVPYLHSLDLAWDSYMEKVGQRGLRVRRAKAGNPPVELTGT